MAISMFSLGYSLLLMFEVGGVKVDVDIGWMITHESISVVSVGFIVPLQRWMIGDILYQNNF